MVMMSITGGVVDKAVKKVSGENQEQQENTKLNINDAQYNNVVDNNAGNKENITGKIQISA
jgi:hypothetical protein